MLKPKSGVHNPRAHLYKRFTDVEKSNKSIAYKTVDNKLWMFDGEKVKKATDVVTNGDFYDGTDNWGVQVQYTGLSVSNGVCTVTVPAHTYIANRYYFSIRSDDGGVERGHKYYCRFEYNLSSRFLDSAILYVAGKIYDDVPVVNDGNDNTFDMISDGDAQSVRNFVFTPNSIVRASLPYDLTYKIWGIHIYDMTEDFGAGNEPTTVESAREYYGSLASQFILLDDSLDFVKTIAVASTDVLKYGGFYYKYDGRWVTAQTSDLATKIGRNNIAQYQLNKYYFVGTFDYMRKGGIDSAETQPTRGLIAQIDSMTIRYFTDDIVIDHDDIIVIKGRLYAVESISTDYKMMPKEFAIHFANLNSIL